MHAHPEPQGCSNTRHAQNHPSSLPPGASGLSVRTAKPAPETSGKESYQKLQQRHALFCEKAREIQRGTRDFVGALSCRLARPPKPGCFRCCHNRCPDKDLQAASQTNFKAQGKNSYIYLFMYMCIHTYIHPCLHPSIHPYIHTYIHTYINCRHTCMHACMHAYIHTYMHAYVHTSRHACMHAYVH